MKENLFLKALHRKNESRPPVWFMRQAGRYHSHYQSLRKRYSFVDLCKIPEVSCEAAMGPVQDFGFDAAILFSDLLFPLEAMGMGLQYVEKPQLGWLLRSPAQLEHLKGGIELLPQLHFQAEALKQLRRALPGEKGLLGFVGGPFTLFCYAVEGGHKGHLDSAKQGLTDGRFQGFCDKLLELLARNMALQASAGADTVAILDTCAGEIEASIYIHHVLPALKELLHEFHRLCPDTPVVYYSKGTDSAYWRALAELPIVGLGIDWKQDLAEVLSEWSSRFAIQGNIDPEWLFLEPLELEHRLREVFEKIRKLPESYRRGWICGLGHGVLPKTPESNVRLFLKIQNEVFG